MSYEDTLRLLGNTTAKSLETVRLQWVAGEITEATARDLWKILLQTAGVQGEALGTLAFDTHARVATGTTARGTASVAAKVPAPNHATSQRMESAIATVLSGPEDEIQARLQRLGFADPVNRAQESFQLRMSSDNRVEKYTRGVESDACELCRWLYKDGYAYPKNKPMSKHTGCVCHQVPVFVKGRKFVDAATLAMREAKRKERELDAAVARVLGENGDSYDDVLNKYKSGEYKPRGNS